MAINRKATSAGVATLAANTVFSKGASHVQRQLAGSALSQSGTNRQTGARMEAIASKALSNPRSAETTKTLAASVLAQSNKKR